MKLDSSALSTTVPASFSLNPMKTVWFAFTVCFALIGLIAYVAWQASLEARVAREEVLMFRQKQNEQLAAGARPMPGILEGIPSSPPPAPQPVTSLPPAPVSSQPDPASSATVSVAPPAFTSPSPAPEPSPSNLPPPAAPLTPASPAPLTAQQSLLASLPAIARVKEAFPNDGFVLIDAGSRKNLTAGMQFNIRRGASLIARVTLTDSIEEDEAIADIQPRTLSPGVTPKAGDEIVQATTTTP
jgi:hypothetical protein